MLLCRAYETLNASVKVKRLDEGLGCIAVHMYLLAIYLALRLLWVVCCYSRENHFFKFFKHICWFSSQNHRVFFSKLVCGV